MSNLQQKVDGIHSFWVEKTHRIPNLPKDFRPWTSGLSPSALYNCGLNCRKKMGYKAPENKLTSLKRWQTNSLSGIKLPLGIYLSTKRLEVYVSDPTPQFTKTEFILLMFPFGNVWSQQAPNVPITEEWMWSEIDGMLMLEALARKDAQVPVRGYFESCYNYMIQNPDQIGIHLKRKRRSE